MPTEEIKEIRVNGWVRTVRQLQGVRVHRRRDGTCFKPSSIVMEANLENFKEIAKLNVGSAIEAEGTIVPTPGMRQDPLN